MTTVVGDRGKKSKWQRDQVKVVPKIYLAKKIIKKKNKQTIKQKKKPTKKLQHITTSKTNEELKMKCASYWILWHFNIIFGICVILPAPPANSE